MTTEEIKKNAPIGATHYDGIGQYFHLIGSKWLFFSNILNDWVLCNPPHNIKPL